MSYQNSAGREALGALAALATAIAIIGLIIIGGWQASWWFRAQDTNRQAQLDKQGIGYQLALQTQIGDEIGQILVLNTRLAAASGDTAGVLDAQRKGTVASVCQKAAQVNPSTPLSGDQAEFVKTNCYAGTISPLSLYNH